MWSMRVFAGEHAARCGKAATERWFICPGDFSPSLSTDGSAELLFCKKAFEHGYAFGNSDCHLGISRGGGLFDCCI